VGLKSAATSLNSLRQVERVYAGRNASCAIVFYTSPRHYSSNPVIGAALPASIVGGFAPRFRLL
jgi:hypothetical protein